MCQIGTRSPRVLRRASGVSHNLGALCRHRKQGRHPEHHPVTCYYRIDPDTRKHMHHCCNAGNLDTYGFRVELPNAKRFLIYNLQLQRADREQRLFGGGHIRGTRLKPSQLRLAPVSSTRSLMLRTRSLLASGNHKWQTAATPCPHTSGMSHCDVLGIIVIAQPSVVRLARW